MKIIWKKILAAAAASMCIVFCSTSAVGADVKDHSFTIMDGDDYYGTLYGAPYSDEDDSKWLTIKTGGRGLRLVNSEDEEILLVDQYGGVYLQGADVTKNMKNNVPYGFLYLLVVVSLFLNVWSLAGRRKK